MKINDELLRKYARLSVSIGVNVQPNQILVIKSPVECVNFTRMIVDEAYKLGAKEVVVHWNDEECAKLKYLNSPMDVFESYPDWMKESMLTYAKDGACFLSISASNPELLKDVDPKKIATAQKASSISTREFSERLMSNKNSWSIIALPTKGWATKVFPSLSEDEAINKLWENIFNIVRVDQENPVKAWDYHKKNLIEKINYLNKKNFKSLHYINSLGTDLNLELVDNHLWIGGAEYTPEGIEFIANMPTEEIFSMPKKTGVNGKVFSSKPLNYGGNLINNFSLTFKDGRVIDFEAKEGYESLKSLIETDEGSHYLGEVALVPFDSPISNSNIVFFNTLYDENASCHLALGKAYNLCVKEGVNKTTEEVLTLGGNDSLTHVDFMIGTSDLNVTGIGFDGSKTPIFINGNWAI
ncbi:aminopeptidase [uncultured Clostridium sp.]|uniref:aminopeptidase n=1 Tax=uncultured Clostridium sp. TaxID=59620 RepID=UPI0032171232